MKAIAILFLTLLFVTACEQENLIETEGGGDIFKDKPQQPSTDKTKITGLWESNGYYNGNMTQKIRMRFNETEESVILASECKYMDGATLYAQVEVEAVFKNNGAEVTSSDQDYQTKQNGKMKYECYASLAPTFFKIGLNGKINVEGFALLKIAD